LPDDGRWKKLQQPDFDVIDRGRPKQRTNGLCFARDGGLLSYGNDQVDSFRRAASYVDRILRGEKPGDLPVQLSVKYLMVLNLKTAKALGLAVPLSIMLRADEVIE
jgi:putative ABC transport system substrate-binding protein